MKSRVLKKAISVLLMISCLFGISIGSNAAVEETITVSANGSNYSSVQSLLTEHGSYYVYLKEFKFSGYAKNTMPSSTGKIYARIYTSSGIAAGDLATFTTYNQSFYKSYWSGHGHGGSYKLKTNSNISYGYWATFSWEP